MFLSKPNRKMEYGGYPRVSGDVSVPVMVTSTADALSPRERGCFRHDADMCRSDLVIPA